MENPEVNIDQRHAIDTEDYRDLVTEIMATRGGLSLHATRTLVDAYKVLDKHVGVTAGAATPSV